MTAPARVCLFGDPLEKLGLDAVTLGVNAGVHVRVEPGGTDLRVIDLDGESRASLPIDPSDRTSLETPGDPSSERGHPAVTTLVEQGVQFDQGALLEVHAAMAHGLGFSVTTARTVALLRCLLDHASDAPRNLSEPRRLAELALATLRRAGSPDPRALDTLAVTHGGLLHLSFGYPAYVTHVPVSLPGLVWIETGEEATPDDKLEEVTEYVRLQIQQMRDAHPGFDPARASFDEVYSIQVDLGRTDTDALWAMLYLRDLTHAGLRVLSDTPFPTQRFGELLDEHHERVRDGLGGSTARTEEVRQRALEAGALGVREIGSHRGGALLAYAPGREDALREALGREAPVHRLEPA